MTGKFVCPRVAFGCVKILLGKFSFLVWILKVLLGKILGTKFFLQL